MKRERIWLDGDTSHDSVLIFDLYRFPQTGSVGGMQTSPPLTTSSNMTRLLTAAIITCFTCLLGVSSVNAQVGTLSTNFLGDTTGATGFTELGTFGFDATFAAPGQVVFFNNGSLYNGSNRAYGVGAGQSSTITFNQTASSVTVFGLDTSTQQTGASPNGTVPANTTLTLADGSITAFDAAGGSLGSFTIGQTGFSSFTFNGPIASLQVSNAGADGSFSLLGDISATAVPEPSSGILMAGLAGLFSLRRRRRS